MEGRKEELTRTRDGGLEGIRWTGDGRVLAASVPAAAEASALVPAGGGREGKLTATWENGWPLKDPLI